MTYEPCPDCRHFVSTEAKRCPICSLDTISTHDLLRYCLKRYVGHSRAEVLRRMRERFSCYRELREYLKEKPNGQKSEQGAVMSYEGTEVYICAAGHMWDQDCFEVDPDYCPECSQPVAWWYGVDQTNHCGVWPVPEPVKVAKTCKCSVCGNAHMVEKARYKIPNNCGHGRLGSTDVQVPFGPAKFEADGEVFDTEDEATNHIHARYR